jgi:hypothetical protein
MKGGRNVRTLSNLMKWTSVCFLIATSLGPVLASGANLRVDPGPVTNRGAPSRIGGCEIKVLDAYFWRDFMPVVSRPGPDGGSPLRAKLKLSIDNSRGAENRFSLKAVFIDEKGQSHPASFRVMQHGGVWGSEIKTSEVREIELVTAEGPYLPVGSGVHVEITWTDRKGESVLVRSPVLPVNRTD